MTNLFTFLCNQFLVFCFLAATSCNSGDAKMENEIQPLHTESDSALPHSVLLLNISDDPVDFFYFDEMSILRLKQIAPQQKMDLHFNKTSLLIQPNLYQNIYYLSRTDTLRLSQDEKRNIELRSKANAATQGLNLFKRINESLSQSGIAFNNTLSKTAKANPDEAAALLQNRYHAQMQFLDRARDSAGSDPGLLAFASQYFRDEYLSGMLSIPLAGYTNFNRTFLARIDSIEAEALSSAEQWESWNNKNLFNTFLRYKKSRYLKDPFFARQLYNEIDNYPISSEARKKQKLFLVGQELTRGSNIDTFLLRKFIEEYSQAKEATCLRSYFNDLKTAANLGTNILLTANLQQISFDDVIKKKRGKVVFVDFWASWCLPCRKQFANSAKLQDELAGEDIAFLYLSIDKNSEDWKKACEEEQLQSEESFLLPNDETADIVKNFKITSVPRYLIIGKDGRVVKSDLLPQINEQTKRALLSALHQN